MATRARELFGEAIVLDDFEAARAQDRRFCQQGVRDRHMAH
jgi:hypothetical protein